MKTKFSGILTLVLAFVVQFTFAQEKTITGIVSDDTGPLPGVSIVIKGTSKGAESDFNGKYSISAKAGDILVYSFVGMKTVEKTVGAANTINIVFEGDNLLEEVVVTAQGIRKEKKAIGYAVTTIKSEDIGSRPATDVARVLQGKAPGVNIQQTSGLAGSGTNIIIRGYSSINGSNQPLFVVDGVPFNSATNSDRGFANGGASASSRFLDIDPNNIAEISVLKGLSATTLYGQAGRNGVVLITTKTGSGGSGTNQKFEVSVDQSYFQTEIANLPEYQNDYGNGFYQGYSQAFSNWGPNFNARGQQGIAADGTVLHPYSRADLATAFPEFQGARYDYKPYNSVGEFFSSGDVVNTSVNVSSGSEKGNYSVGFGRTDETGFVPTSNYQRLNFSFGGSVKLSNKLNISTSVNFSRTAKQAPPTGVGFGSNPIGASLFSNVLYTPRSVDLIGLPYENPIDNSSIFYRAGNDIQNPFWTLNNITDNERVNRFFTNISVNYDLTDWLNISYRLAYDTYTQTQEFRANKGGPQILGGSLVSSTRLNEVWDHTLSLNFNKELNSDFNLDGSIALNPRREVLDLDGVASSQQFVYGLLTHGNFEESNGFSGFRESNVIGAFGSATLGYKNFAYLNVQARNDWFSSLPKENRSIFYPSASISFIPTAAFENLKASSTLNYLKMRFGYGSSAGFPDAYSTVVGLGSATNVFTDPDGAAVNILTVADRLGNPDLKPELIQELEAGIEAKLFKNRLTLDISVYKKTSTDLIIQNKPLDPATGFTVTSDNIGEISNKGIEVGFSFAPIRSEDQDGFRWDVNGQWSVNENIVEDNGGSDGSITIFAGFGAGAPGNAAISGQPFGVFVGSAITRDDNGNLVVGSNGSYLVDNGQNVIGDPNADWRGTVINEFSYKGFSLQAQFEYQHGGDMYSTTAAALLSRGLTVDTNFDRSQTYVLPGVRQDGAPNDIQIAATDVGFRNTGFFIDEQAIYDATSIRLREVSLGYRFPKKLIDKTPFGSLRVNFIGQNLWYKAVNFPKGLNFDPDVSSTGVGNGQGFDLLTGPTSKRYGFSVNLTF